MEAVDPELRAMERDVGPQQLYVWAQDRWLLVCPVPSLEAVEMEEPVEARARRGCPRQGLCMWAVRRMEALVPVVLLYGLAPLLEARAMEWAVERRLEAVDPAPRTMEREVDLHQFCTLLGAGVWAWGRE